ncbi:MAG: Holliday junction resolvase RuvX [Pseudobdellovibrio sp.]
MPRILAIDYGTKRCGIAVTDNLQIIATALETVPTHTLFSFLENYFAKEKVECMIVGNPKKLDNTPSETAQHVVGFVRKMKEKYPDLKIELLDERFTSVMAKQTMIDSGISKKQRQNKGSVDLISAVLLLQNYLETKKF